MTLALFTIVCAAGVAWASGADDVSKGAATLALVTSLVAVPLSPPRVAPAPSPVPGFGQAAAPCGGTRCRAWSQAGP